MIAATAPNAAQGSHVLSSGTQRLHASCPALAAFRLFRGLPTVTVLQKLPPQPAEPEANIDHDVLDDNTEEEPQRPPQGWRRPRTAAPSADHVTAGTARRATRARTVHRRFAASCRRVGGAASGERWHHSVSARRDRPAASSIWFARPIRRASSAVPFAPGHPLQRPPLTRANAIGSVQRSSGAVTALVASADSLPLPARVSRRGSQPHSDRAVHGCIRSRR